MSFSFMTPSLCMLLMLCVSAKLFHADAGRALTQGGRQESMFSHRQSLQRCITTSMNSGRCWMSWHMAEEVVRGGIPGDVIETGVASGAQSLLMYSALRHYHSEKRSLMADAWQGLPEAKHAADVADVSKGRFKKGSFHIDFHQMVSHFKSAGVQVTSDPHIAIYRGFFNETLHTIPINVQFSVLRLDGDMYESTMQALTALYPKLSVGGFLYVDDYDTFEACRKAVDDYRRQNGVGELIYRVAEPRRLSNDGAIYWRKGWVGTYSQCPTS